MEILYKPYHSFKGSVAENNVSKERTAHIVLYFTYEQMKYQIDGGTILTNLVVNNVESWENLVEKWCGFKVELITTRLEDLDEKDHKLRGEKIILPTCKNVLHVNPDEEAQIELSQNMQSPFAKIVKKMEFRVVVPYRVKMIELNIKCIPNNINPGPYTIDDYKNDVIRYPQLININSKYSISVEDYTPAWIK